MNRIITLIGCALVLTAVLLFGRHIPTQAAANATPVCGAIGTTTWTLANSPYDVCVSGVTIGPTTTLTIQPAVTVLFDNGITNKLNVPCTLSAIGTVTQPITFTGVKTTPGSWAGIWADYTNHLGSTCQLELRHARQWRCRIVRRASLRRSGGDDDHA